ncbi:MAG: 2-oxo acid dehydrogenase subunit E2 [Mycobacteriaceae bacterium]
MPDAGEGLTEAEILTWHVAPGDTVAVNQIIVEIETAKAAVELPCPFAGTVAELLVEPGVTVEVGAPIITIETDASAPAPHQPATPTGTPAAAGEPADGAAADGAGAAPAGSGKIGEEMPGGRIATLVGYGPRAGAKTRRARVATTSPVPVPQEPGVVQEAPPTAGVSAEQESPPAAAEPVGPVGETARPAAGASQQRPEAEPRPAGVMVPLAKPPVRALARSLGVDLAQLTGSGADGVITRADVHSAADGAPAPAGSTAQAAPAQAGERRVPVKGVRRMTAAAMVASAFSAPHVTEFLTVDVTPMMTLRTKLKNHPDFAGLKITPLTFAAKAVCLAVARTPDVNARFDAEAGESGEIVYFDQVNLGIAAATPRGLMVPNVRGAQAMPLAELAAALGELTTTAREGRTSPASMTGGTFTITNVGVFGVDTGTPIINPGESAILALGAIKPMPWVVDGEIVVRTVCQLALSFDHRVVDGQQGSRFLADVGALLADPGMALTY